MSSLRHAFAKTLQKVLHAALLENALGVNNSLSHVQMIQGRI